MHRHSVVSFAQTSDPPCGHGYSGAMKVSRILQRRVRRSGGAIDVVADLNVAIAATSASDEAAEATARQTVSVRQPSDETITNEEARDVRSA